MSIKNKIHSELFKIKIICRNLKAKPKRREAAAAAIVKLREAKELPNRIFFCGVPVHKNLGDQGQRYCIEKWCRESFPDHHIIAIPIWAFYEKDFRRTLEASVNGSDLFVIQSGYCTTSRHYDHPMHRYIASAFRNNAVLIMPQTVRFNEEKDGRRTGRVYNAHKRLLFLARDKISYEAAKKYFSETNVLLYPDIVTTLIGSFTYEGRKDGVLLCVRNDGEKKYGNAQVEQLKQRFEDEGVRCQISDTNSELELDTLVENYEAELRKVIEYFASFKAVITDRYHRTIFSLIANTAVIVLATKDHKVRTGTEWFKGVYDGAYRNADSIEDAYAMAESILNSDVHISNNSYFKQEYYDKLKTEFERITQFHG